MIPTHLSFFLLVCHPSRTFPLKDFEREPQNRLPLLPIARPYPFLPLTHGPPLLYWLGTGWCCLSLVRAPLPCVSKVCLLLMRFSWPRARLYVLLLILYDLLSSWAGPCLIVGLSLFNPFFTPSIDLLAFLPCHYVIPAMVLLGLCLLGLFLGPLYTFSFT